MDENNHVNQECKSATIESIGRATVLYAEFDDEGWMNPQASPDKVGLLQPIGKEIGLSDISQTPDAIARIDYFLNEDVKPEEKLLVVVYVHGWKHTAASDDENVVDFRKQIRAISARSDLQDTRIVGIYVGWRGTPFKTASGIAENLTFFNRKAAAERIARGSINELLGHIQARESLRNGDQQSDSHGILGQTRQTAQGSEYGHMTTLYVGHSFGALILFEAVSNSLLERIVAGGVEAAAGRPDTIARAPDTVVLLNPAVEASRFEPIYRAMLNRIYTHYQAPLMALVTSDGDSATGTWFPVSQWFSFRETTTSEQRQANLDTIGHDCHYVTHFLRPTETKQPRTCGTWASGAWPRCVGENTELDLMIDACLSPASYETRVDAAKDIPPAAKRNSLLPVWNITTVASVIPNHNDVYGDDVLELVKNLAVNAVQFPAFIASDTTRY